MNSSRVFYREYSEEGEIIYRGLKFRPSIKFTGGLDVWDKERGEWFYTALVNDKKALNYFSTEQPGKWGRTMDVGLFDLETMNPAGTLRFEY